MYTCSARCSTYQVACRYSEAVQSPQAANLQLLLVVHSTREEAPAAVALAIVQPRAPLLGVDQLLTGSRLKRHIAACRRQLVRDLAFLGGYLEIELLHSR